ncbi:hypothetical protein J3E68DRAFT_421134 [Trichoderma sp. SZMC 28012]
MATYKQLQREPVTRELFNNRITTLQGLQNFLNNSAFVAIDTEHFSFTSEEDRILHQVGLAYVQNLTQDLPRTSAPSHNTSRPYLPEFYANNEVRALTLNINLGKEKRDEITFKRQGGLPVRRRHRFGREQLVDLRNLEGAIMDFIKSCNGKANLVLMGFEMAAEWTYLSRYFPQVIPFFSAWVDLRDIAKDITSSVGIIPGLVSLLKMFGYHWKDIQPGKKDLDDGLADNAGDDAVATCALANALLDLENQEKLKFRQECGKIAGISTKRNGFRSPNIRDRFVATISADGPLPSTINSGMKVAGQFFNYSPQSTGIMSKETAYLTFKSQEQMNQFVTAVHGQSLPTGEILSVQGRVQEQKATAKENSEKKEKQELRKGKKLARAGSEVDDIGYLFS